MRARVHPPANETTRRSLSTPIAAFDCCRVCRPKLPGQPLLSLSQPCALRPPPSSFCFCPSSPPPFSPTTRRSLARSGGRSRLASCRRMPIAPPFVNGPFPPPPTAIPAPLSLPAPPLLLCCACPLSSAPFFCWSCLLWIFVLSSLLLPPPPRASTLSFVPHWNPFTPSPPPTNMSTSKTACETRCCLFYALRRRSCARGRSCCRCACC